MTSLAVVLLPPASHSPEMLPPTRLRSVCS